MARVQDLEVSIQEALRRRVQAPQTAPGDVAPRAGESKPHIASQVAARGIVQQCEAVAAEMENTGQTVIGMANAISAETAALAELLRKHGAAIDARVEEFMTMSERVRDKMRDVQADVISTSGAEAPLAATGRHEEGMES